MAICLLCLAVSVVRAQPANPQEAGGRVLVIGTKEAPPFAMKADDGTWRGISIDLWRRLADQLHLQYRFKETTLEGLIDEPAAGSLDASIAAITVTKDRDEKVDFTQPFFTTGLGIAVPKINKFNWFGLVSTLFSLSFLEAVLGLIGVTLLVGVAIWLLERRHTEHFGRHREGLVSSLWWSAQAMTQANPEKTPTTTLGRLLAMLWMGLSVIAIAVLTAGLTAQLTVKQLQGLVHGVDDLQSVRVGVVRDTASLDYLTRRGIGFHTYNTANDGLTALQAGKLDAFVYDRPLLAWTIRRGFADTLDILDVTFDRQNYAIAVPNGSALRQSINLMLLPLLNSQWWEELNKQYLGRE